MVEKMNDKKIVLVVGGNMGKDVRKVFGNPKKAENDEPGLKIYVESLEQLSSILSTKKITLFQYLSEHKGKSVGEIAGILGRKQEAISRDLQLLKDFGLVKMKKKGRKSIPMVSARKITMEFG